ncbi:MAG: preprotein translocase subunit SecG [Blastocatellia bacterium]
MIEYLLLTLYIVSCFVLIIFVLLQPGKADAAAIFGGGGASSTAFGPRGTRTVLAKVTVTAAVVFFLIAFLFSIPGLFEKRSLGQGVKRGAATAPSPVQPVAPAPVTSGSPSAAPSTAPSTSPSSGATKPSTPATAPPSGAASTGGNPGQAAGGNANKGAKK